MNALPTVFASDDGSVASSAATAAHGVSFIPNFSRPDATSGARSAPSAWDTTNVLVLVCSPRSSPPSAPRELVSAYAPAPTESKDTANTLAKSSPATPSAHAADARLNALLFPRISPASTASPTRSELRAIDRGASSPGPHSSTSTVSTFFR